MTQYCVELRMLHNGACHIDRYASALERALGIIGYAAWADVLRTWEEVN